MKTKSPFALGLAFLLSLIITVPADISAEPQTGGQKAGEVARVIPAVSIARGSKNTQCFRKDAGRMAGLGEHQDRRARAYRPG